MSDDLKKGDHVTWRSHGGSAEGTVDKRYLVRSETSGGAAVHPPSALTTDDDEA